MEDNFTVALCQMKVVEDKTKNIEHALSLISEAASVADLVILPEMWNCPYQTTLFPKYAEKKENSQTLSAISGAAKKENIHIVAGSIPELYHGNIYNSSFIINPQGKILDVHRKVHLFDIDVPGEISFKESETLTAGNQITVVDTPLCRIGICICYDIRFSELSRLMALEGAQLIIVPGAFNLTTGPAHWKPLIQVRAIDNQVFMAANSPARDINASYVAYGHSMVADPWGNILKEAGTGEEIIYANIDLDLIPKIRQELPLLKNRRTDLYQIIGKE
ncbi:carbon-nitrogen hydrolase family protein [Methanobacterium subterraneum]|uniref:Carbon-nitrogen hydrolase family protein n=1 Tax=Methanobacterium subterraneum TaxID=59277 RepID=A0A7K4DJ38_9EURY|nr:carbon-nitrogen hydrolase family protein [Methanobacterium subterraneum]MBW4257453.1 carbon-nitrogen hydrolase family protein [Methanobacterium sp. YSL]NMO08259.1 carbon-nitrogen hydrolase family protein [Methanobacterium subterraneum]